MPLKLTCPHCGRPTALQEPFPLAGGVVRCTSCAESLQVTYPPGVMEQLKARGKRFRDELPGGPGDAARPPRAPDSVAARPPRAPDSVAARPPRAPDPVTARPPRAPAPPPPRAARKPPAAPEAPPEPPRRAAPPARRAPSGDPGTSVPTSVDPTMVQEPTDGHFDRTVPSGMTPYGALPSSAEPPRPAHRPSPTVAPPDDADDTGAFAATEIDGGLTARPLASAMKPAGGEPTSHRPARPGEPTLELSAPGPRDPKPAAAPVAPRAAAPAKASEPKAAARASAPKAAAPKASAPKASAPKAAVPAKASGGAPPPTGGASGSGRGGCLRRFALGGVVATALLGLAGGAVAVGGYVHFSKDLPTVEALQAYEPPTVTEVYDKDGELLGEIYEQRRYVRPLSEIPKVMQDAFVAAEDDVFWTHGGVDWTGLVAAVINEVTTGGSGSRGASTITMQVTRNFLLTRQKTYERKIREILLSRRLEQAYDKEHILYLYLNEIYLGSGAYGVEAAARVYFGKHIDEVSLAEAAMIAGLAPAPSKYSPHRNFDLAKRRQQYVLGRMLAIGLIDQQAHDAALAEDVVIVEKSNEFLEAAPHFTEYVRRHLVETYGHDRVYNEGLRVRTTCDLDLQKHAQQQVVEGVHEVDHRMGFRRQGLETLQGDDAIAARREEHEKAMRDAWAFEQDPAGRVPPPEKSVLEPERIYDAVVLEVDRSWARVGIGEHEAVIPIAWSGWVFEPNPKRSWRYRTATDLTAEVDTDGDGRVDTPILQKGDVVKVRVEALSTRDGDVSKAFRGTPGAGSALVAARLWQDPEVEGALLSFDVETGAVRAMVGGADFEKSEFNRAVQSVRQVGSTFKPIVYAAAIESERVTTASMVTDGPLAFTTSQDFIWKPANYGHDYLGNITLKRALALSRNTCTVRVLDTMDPGMNDDVVYSFARRLGIGGPPSHTLPESHVATPENDHLCPWTRETPDSTICMDRYPPKDPDISNTRHRQLMGPDDEYWCRTCDLSMGLGSASLTMEELLRAYSAFASGGKLVEPYYIEEVTDRNGDVLERHEPREFAEVMDPAVASITTWLLEGVIDGGTAARANRLGLRALAGKTGTTNDEKDTWFVGFTNDVITGVWVGYDQPRSLGISSTGGRTALPIWMDYMEVAAPKDKDRPFPMRGDIEWAQIDEKTGRRVSSGGVRYPFLEGTAPEETGFEAGQVTAEDLITDM